MFISNLIWDEYRVEHIFATRLIPMRSGEICEDPLHLAHREGQERLPFVLTDRQWSLPFCRTREIEGHSVSTSDGSRYD